VYALIVTNIAGKIPISVKIVIPSLWNTTKIVAVVWIHHSVYGINSLVGTFFINVVTTKLKNMYVWTGNVLCVVRYVNIINGRLCNNNGLHYFFFRNGYTKGTFCSIHLRISTQLNDALS